MSLTRGGFGTIRQHPPSAAETCERRRDAVFNKNGDRNGQTVWPPMGC